ncbi:MAG: MarR family winged helix-turn-helix transcriptional regulator [Hyphomicrobiales bacterium]
MNAPPPDDPLLFRFFNEIGIIEQLARARFERGLPHGLTLSQFKVLNHFARLGGEKSPLSLARAFQVTNGAVTNAVQKLEAKGFVETRPDPDDGRGKLVRLTDAGRAARDDAIATLRPVFPLLHSAFSDAEFAAVLPFLERLRKFLDDNRDMTPPRGSD